MNKRKKSEYGTKDVPQPARFIKAGYYTSAELRALIKGLELHERCGSLGSAEGEIVLGEDL